jgi:hypothetical protein
LLAGERQILIPILDDATRRLLFAQPFPSESTQAVMIALRAVINACSSEDQRPSEADARRLDDSEAPLELLIDQGSPRITGPRRARAGPGDS